MKRLEHYRTDAEKRRTQRKIDRVEEQKLRCVMVMHHAIESRMGKLWGMGRGGLETYTSHVHPSLQFQSFYLQRFP